MLRPAKQYNEIVANGKESPESTKKWRENAARLKKEFCFFIYKKNLWFYIVALFVSLVLVIMSLLNSISTIFCNLLLSLACSIISGIIVAFFLERNSNKKWYTAQIDKFNYDLGRVYSSIQRITGYVLLSEVVIGNYALNAYARSKGVDPIAGNNSFVLESEVRELYKGKIDEIPYAKEFASSNIASFIQLLDDTISKTDELLIIHHEYLTEDQKNAFSGVLYYAEEFRTRLHNFEHRVFVVNIKTFDDIILWAHKTATDELIMENYMKE